MSPPGHRGEDAGGPARRAGRLGIPVVLAALRLLRLIEDAEREGKEQPDVPPPFAARQKTALLSFVRLLDDMQEAAGRLGIVELFEQVIQRTGYREYVLDDKAGEERWENVKELGTVVAQFAGLAPGSGLASFLEEVSLVSDVDTMRDEQDQVTLMTLHAAKGLEFPVLFMPGMEEGVLPHARALEALDEVEFDEERRLPRPTSASPGRGAASSILTRRRPAARLRRVNHASTEPSRFLDEIPPELLRHEESRGDALRSAARGWGYAPNLYRHEAPARRREYAAEDEIDPGAAVCAPAARCAARCSASARSCRSKSWTTTSRSSSASPRSGRRRCARSTPSSSSRRRRAAVDSGACKRRRRAGSALASGPPQSVKRRRGRTSLQPRGPGRCCATWQESVQGRHFRAAENRAAHVAAAPEHPTRDFGAASAFDD